MNDNLLNNQTPQPTPEPTPVQPIESTAPVVPQPAAPAQPVAPAQPTAAQIVMGDAPAANQSPTVAMPQPLGQNEDLAKGIIGAVLGLIQVMQNLNDPSRLGAGIAVAFVATIYGLVIANLLCIPYSTRAKRKYAHIFTSMEVMIEGILSIQAGESPALIERKLECYIVDKKDKKD